MTDALTALTDATEVTISAGQVGLLSVTGRLDETGLTQLRGQLQVLVDRYSEAYRKLSLKK